MTTADQNKAQSSIYSRDIEVAREVLTIESDALTALASTIDGDFSQALDLLMAVSGRIIVSGLGKSGHVARKIAATLASTGSPAFFVHPAEASHGDLGMITKADAILMLSNSGENQELKDLIAHTKRFDIPLIGISSRADSTLMEAATVGLLLPKVPEACPMGMAPTTSSTMMLALGDTLAVALMERRGFSADDYRVLHPGGQLGKALVRVKDIMHGVNELPLCKPETSMQDLLLVMTSKHFGCVGITDKDGALIGVFTDGDLRRHIGNDFLSKTAADVMTSSPKTIRPAALVAEAVGFMNNAKITCLFVVDTDDSKGQPIGIVHMHDCLKAGVA